MPLKGFISESDLNTIKVDKDNTELIYTDANAGDSKELVLNPESSYVFSLSGHNNENYTLDMSTLPRIEGVIHKRPVNIDFYPILKVYDGNCDVPNYQLRYYFQNTASSQSGMIYGTGSTRNVMSIDYNKLTKQNKNRYYIDITDGGIGYKIGDTFTLHGNRVTANVSSPLVYVDEVDEYGTVTKASIQFDSVGFYDEPFCADNVVEFVDGKYRGDSIPIEYTSGVSDKFYPNVEQRLDNNEGWYTFGLEHTNKDNEGAGLKIHIPFISKAVQLYDESLDITAAIRCDFGHVKLSTSTKVKFENPNVTTSLVPLLISNYSLNGADDVHNNYEIENIYGYGMIVKRPLVLAVEPESRIYNGSREISCKVKIISGMIENDDVTITSNVIATLVNKNASSNCEVMRESIVPSISGINANNYIFEIGTISPVVIYKREVQCIISDISFIRSTKEFQIIYSISNRIVGDDVRLDLNELKLNYTNKQSGKELSLDLALTASQYDGNIKQYTTDGEIDSTGVYRYKETGVYSIDVEQSTQDVELIDNDVISVTGLKLIGNNAENYELINLQTECNIHIKNIH